MSQVAANLVSVYTLPLTGGGLDEATPARPQGPALSEPLLCNSIEWFCRLRWGMAALLAAAGVVGNSGTVADATGLTRVGNWPFVCMSVLIVANVGFLLHARHLGQPQSSRNVRANLWCQIVMDLALLTVVVHLVGSTTTFIAFAYLFHIVLACIFFPARLSLLVTVLAAGLFVLCVIAEQFGPLQPQAISKGPSSGTRGEVVFDVASALLIWTAVWHLASHLTAAVRQRDAALVDVNRRLLAAQEERTKHLLTTTHQLKSPFAAIHANAQLLVLGHCGPLNEQAMAVARRMVARCHRLTREIQEMLQLANLGSTSQDAAPARQMDLTGLIRSCLGDLEPICRERKIQLDLQLGPAVVAGSEDHFKMLLGNLLSNAMAYSHVGGPVRVICGMNADGCAYATIADEGIGIKATKLPHIFDDYYRANEAVQHNPESSGLGLAIVRNVAQLNGIQVRVESQEGAGTSFHLVFPRSITCPEDGPA